MKNNWFYRNLIKSIKIYLFSAGIIFLFSNSSEAQNKLPEEIDFRLGTMSYANANMSYTEVEATLKIYMEEFRKRFIKRGVKKIIINYKSYNSSSELEQDIIKGKVNVFTISTTDFYKFNNVKSYESILSGVTSLKSKFDNYILITNSSTINLSQIVSEQIQVSTIFPHQLKIMWVKLVLSGKNKPNKFNIVESQLSEGNLILSVFFGKTKHAVVTKAAFDLVCELNPQVKEKLRVLSESQDLVNTFIGYKKGDDVDMDMIYTVTSVGQEIKDDPVGKQILNLFKIDRMEELSLEEMKPTESLINKYNALYKKK